MTYTGLFEEGELLEKKNKQIKFLQDKCRKAGKRIKELEVIEKSHKELNGKLHIEIEQLKKDKEIIKEGKEYSNMNILIL